MQFIPLAPLSADEMSCVPNDFYIADMVATDASDPASPIASETCFRRIRLSAAAYILNRMCAADARQDHKTEKTEDRRERIKAVGAGRKLCSPSSGALVDDMMKTEDAMCDARLEEIHSAHDKTMSELTALSHVVFKNIDAQYCVDRVVAVMDLLHYATTAKLSVVCVLYYCRCDIKGLITCGPLPVSTYVVRIAEACCRSNLPAALRLFCECSDAWLLEDIVVRGCGCGHMTEIKALIREHSHYAETLPKPSVQ